MREEVYAPDPLNYQASVLVDAQTDIKTAIKQTVLSGKGKEAVKAQVRKIIDRAIARIRSPTLKEDGRISLMRFADRAYSQFTAELKNISPSKIAAVIVLMRAITSQDTSEREFYKPATLAERRAAQTLSYPAFNTGVPIQEFTKKYIVKVSAALDNLAEINALDPNDVSGRNSLRNLAEMQVRYESHQDEIASFKERGTRLVVCSVHGDCSKRCSKYQGLVYSLDGTEGYTEDGKEFRPLEWATENPEDRYTTSAGKVYQNGLFGFNCRHKLFEYKSGMVIPTVSKEEQQREYAITQRQRQLERSVIHAREKALEFKDVNVAEYRKWKAEATRRDNVYKAYSEEFGRAYYPDRVKIL